MQMKQHVAAACAYEQRQMATCRNSWKLLLQSCGHTRVTHCIKAIQVELER
jgi:hypothetical protein